MKTKIFEDENVIIYKKGSNEIGYEADTADSVFTAALIGAKTFASHLESPMNYYIEVQAKWGELLKELGIIIYNNSI